jgi:hypothetical protein
MFESVINAKYLKDYKIWIEFDDGISGEIDLEEKIKGKKGIFKPLQKIDCFKNFQIKNDT